MSRSPAGCVVPLLAAAAWLLLVACVVQRTRGGP